MGSLSLKRVSAATASSGKPTFSLALTRALTCLRISRHFCCTGGEGVESLATTSGTSLERTCFDFFLEGLEGGKREKEEEETRFFLRVLSLCLLGRREAKKRAFDSSSHLLQLLLLRQSQAREDAVEGLDLCRDCGRGRRHVEERDREREKGRRDERDSRERKDRSIDTAPQKKWFFSFRFVRFLFFFTAAASASSPTTRGSRTLRARPS